MSSRAKHVARGSHESFMRRNSPAWRTRHPGKSKWTTVPVFPGTRLHQDLYIAKTKPKENGYPELHSGYAVFASRTKARRGCPEDALAYYESAPDITYLTDSYQGFYTFHSLVKLPTTPWWHRRHRR